MNYYYLISLIIIILIILYSLCYYIYPSSIIILQTTLNDFDFNLLFQKQPLIISDKIININDIINFWFSPNIIQNYTINDINKWYINNYKYLFINSSNDNNEILLLKAGKKLINDNPDEKEQIIAIKLKNNQSLIVPYKWHFYCNTTDIKILGIHDYITNLLKYI